VWHEDTSPNHERLDYVPDDSDELELTRSRSETYRFGIGQELNVTDAIGD
jgi:hypothetical protein